uniref:Secreted protein n=1 Tax=Ciona intestinalis TaxID=7719 RepID=H2XWU2_CIOIN
MIYITWSTITLPFINPTTATLVTMPCMTSYSSASFISRLKARSWNSGLSGLARLCVNVNAGFSNTVPLISS